MLRFFAYLGDCNCEFHATEAEAIKACEAAIDSWMCRESGEWSDEVERVCWGVVKQRADETNRRERCKVENCEERFGGSAPCDGGHHGGFDIEVEYALRDVEG